MAGRIAVKGTAFLALVALACAKPSAQVDTAADVQAISAVREREISAFSSGVVDSLVAVYTSDVVMMPPNEPMINGAEAVRTWAQNVASQATVAGKYTDAKVTVAGDWAVERYIGELTMTPKAGGAAATEHLKGIHVYQRQPDGSWRIAQDVWNSDAPPPAPSPAPKGRTG
jgi:ketosteroid isomerase-like protein